MSAVVKSATFYLSGGEDTVPCLGRIIERLHRVFTGEDPWRVISARRILEYIDSGIVEDNMTRATVLGLRQEQRLRQCTSQQDNPVGAAD